MKTTFFSSSVNCFFRENRCLASKIDTRTHTQKSFLFFNNGSIDFGHVALLATHMLVYFYNNSNRND